MRSVPKRRFKGFSEPWEQRKLLELASSITKGTTPLDKSGNGNVNFIKIENIDPLSNKIISAAKITREEHEGYLKRSQLQENDILFSIAGTLGRVTTVSKEILPANTNQALAIIRLKSGCLSYITTYLKGKTVSEYIKQNPTIGAQPNLSLEQVGNLEIFLPQDEEQKKIGEYFRQFDNLINLHHRTLEKLQAMKQAYLHEMFPVEGERVPKRRFAGFIDPWEQRKLGYVARFSKGKGYSKSDLTETGTPIILYGRLYTNYQTVISEVDTYAEAKDGSIYSLGGEVIVPSSGETAEDIARASVVETKGIILGGDLNIIHPDRDIDSAFLALSISSGCRKKELAKKAEGASVVHLYNTDLPEVEISYPTKEEQIRIAVFFRNLDQLITLQQRKVEKLRAIKQAYLREMFV